MGANKESLRQNKLNPPIVPRDPVFPVEDAPQEDSCAGWAIRLRLYIKVKAKQNALFSMT